jgi:hypothetical protein
MHYSKIIIGMAIFVFISMACKLSGGGATQAPPIDISATQNALSTAVAAQATTLAQATLDAQAAAELVIEASATATPAAFSAEQTPAAQGASVTQGPSIEATVTPAVDSAATQQAQAIVGIVQQLFDEGIISTKEGDYYRLDDFNESWAQLGYYQWWKTGYSAENFILSADIAWESASDKANWPEAGCGIVFSEDGESDHHLAYLSLDGFGRLAQISKGQGKKTGIAALRQSIRAYRRCQDHARGERSTDQLLCQWAAGGERLRRLAGCRQPGSNPAFGH